MNQETFDSGWREWGKHVLSELERLSETTTDIQRDIQRIHVEIAMLKVKSGVWGAIGGLIPVLAYLLMDKLGK